MSKAKKTKENSCPCGSGRDYAACCGRFHEGLAWPETPEELMRSRYSAFVMGNDAWLRQTWTESTCPKDDILDASIKWLGLEVKSQEIIDQTHATVCFVARGRYKNMGAFRMREKSTFEKIDGRWMYVDGEVDEGEKHE